MRRVGDCQPQDSLRRSVCWRITNRRADNQIGVVIFLQEKEIKAQIDVDEVDAEMRPLELAGRNVEIPADQFASDGDDRGDVLNLVIARVLFGHELVDA